jgi:glycosyltransferase involved in cell wall biosynthesis
VTAARHAPSVTVLVPGDIETRTGGYEYDRRIAAGLRDLGWQLELVQLDASFPFPTTAARSAADRALASIADASVVLVDGLALGALPDAAARHAGRLAMVALVHHPLAAESGLNAADAASLFESERRALASARAVVVTSRATASALAAYGVAADRISVVEPGTDPAPLSRGSQALRNSGNPETAIGNLQSASRNPDLSLLCVATLTPRKGHQILMRALTAVHDVDWRLVCAGSVDRDRATAAQVRDLIRELGLEHRVALVGDLDAARLAIEYDRADLFVLATRYEGYGMAVAEALARGLPVVSTSTGAIADLVADRAGIVVPPDDVAAFTSALERVMRDRSLRERLRGGARATRARLPTWHAAAEAMAQILGRHRG